jgi:hypothetical protein
MIKNIILVLLSLLVSPACSHTLRFKGAHFVQPTVAEKPLSGRFTLSAANDTRVTVVDNIDGNPPDRTEVRINEDIDVTDLFGLNYLGFEAGLGIYKALAVPEPRRR